MIKSIEIQNFRAIKSRKVSFGPGLNAVVGPNTIGKSTLLQAIAFALYGARAVPCDEKDIPNTDSNGKVEVRLTLDDGHKVIRTRSHAKVVLEGQDMASGKTPTADYITEHLGLDYNGFNLFHYSSQGETAAVLTLGATELQRAVEKYAGVDIIDQVIKKARLDVTVIQARMEGLQYQDPAPLEADLKEADKGLEHATALARGTEEAAGKAEAKEREAMQKVRDAQQHNEIAEKQNRRLDRLKQAHEISVRDRAALLEDIVALGDVTDRSGELEERSHKLGDEMDTLSKHNAKFSAVEQDLQRVRRRIKSFEESDPRMEAKIAGMGVAQKCRDSLEEAKEALTEAQMELVAQGVANDKLNQAVANSVCEACGRPFEGSDIGKIEARLAAALEKKKQIRAKVDRCSKAYIKASDDKEAVDSSLAQYDDLPVSREGYEQSKEQAHSDEAALSDELNKLGGLRDLSELRKELATVTDALSQNHSKIRQHKRLQDKLHRVEIGMKQNEKDLKACKVLTTVDIGPLMDEHDKLSRHYKALAQEASDARLEHEEMVHIRNRIAEALRLRNETNAKVKALTEELDDIRRLVKYLTKARTTFLQSIWRSILDNATSFAQLVTSDWNGADESEVKHITEVSRTEEGKFRFSENGRPRPVTAASGAQRAVMGIGMRLGLNAALNGGGGLLMLDEPTESVSESNSSLLIGGLTAIPGQKIVVTHRVADAAVADQVISFHD